MDSLLLQCSARGRLASTERPQSPVVLLAALAYAKWVGEPAQGGFMLFGMCLCVRGRECVCARVCVCVSNVYVSVSVCV